LSHSSAIRLLVGNGGWSDGGGVALSEMRSARCVNYAPKETPHRGNENTMFPGAFIATLVPG
jgi:hypothetical protein